MRRLWILGLPFLVALSAALGDQLVAPTQAAAYDDGDYYRDRDLDDDDDALGSEVTVRYFRDELAPYGEWARVPTYGWAWRPYNVGAGWQPYTLGRWINTDYGWTWASDEPWGRSPYHYGRWYWDRRYGGWVWVPGRRWAPAWVDWREGARYWGWAPLPPTAAWQSETGIPTRTIIIEPRHYCFVEKRYIVEPDVHRYIAPPAQNVRIIHNTTNITHYALVNHRVANHAIREATVEKAIGHQVPRYPVAEVESAAPRAFHKPDAHGAPTRPAEQNEPRRGFEVQSAAPPAAVEARGREQVGHDRVDAAERERARLDHEREDRDRKAVERAQDAERQREAARTREAARQTDAERQRESLRRHELEVREHEANERREVERSREAAHQQAIRRQEAERARTERRAEDEAARRQQAEVERHRAPHPHPPQQQQQTDPPNGQAPPPRQPH